MNRIRASLSYSNVVSTLCLFLLVGGGAAWAATQLPKNSVGPKQLKQGAVTSAKLKQGAVTSAKLKQGAVTPAKLSKTAKAALTGPAGPAGPPGPKGDSGAPATALWAEVSENGKVLKGSGVVGALQPFGDGSYQVEFNRDVTGCVYQATAAGGVGSVLLAEPREKAPNSVYVEARESFDGAAVDTRFSLAVFC